VEYASSRAKLEVVADLVQRNISANAHSALGLAECKRQYDEYAVVNQVQVTQDGKQQFFKVTTMISYSG
jgi:hypothetical protein